MSKTKQPKRDRIVLEQKHRTGIHMLSIVGHATYDQMLETMSKRQIKNLLDWGVIERDRGVYYKEKRNQVFKLSEEGKKDARFNFRISAFYACDSVFHDVHLAEKYLQLDPEDRANCITEKQFKNVFIQWCQEDLLTRGQHMNQTGKNGNLSLPDFAYKKNGQWMLVEISNDYPNNKIEAKYRLEKLMGAKMDFQEVGRKANKSLDME